MPPKPDLATKTSSRGLAELGLVLAAGVVGGDPGEVAGQHVLPQRLDVLARAQRRVDLAAEVGGVEVGEQVTDGDLAAEVDVREGRCIIIAASIALREVRWSRLMLGSSVSCAR